MIAEYFTSLDPWSWQAISMLIGAGFLVGVINTIAGSGTVITYSLFMLMGLPANMANGTVRIGVIMQTLAATLTFKKAKILELRKGFFISLPIVVGSVVGAQIAVSIPHDIFEKVLAVVLIFMVVFIFFDPSKWIHGQQILNNKRLGWWQYLLFFLTGVYGGFIHIGVGIFLLTALVLAAGYDLVRANAIKIMAVFLYAPFALAVFIINGEVNYHLGLIAAIGNLIGGITASKLAIKKGAGFIRWFLIVIIVLFAMKLLNIFELS
ncbi:Sulfite exporter TauE/SafE [Salinivirga cyanobacteriivorans]|uniref:Probable membrane transporter protein n=1 Tax=Salinivirga cyanobacteriivorans TaxID=1307839 RepID=A0A0S2HVC9_9BACT|nr:sulfite exporter TauE/SafE family protein [Salinivirga cyanobacteriivorans]ALO13992.1 Sulfite exporter TauE/SafE [Salinivirga cyanobacteriivorans]